MDDGNMVMALQPVSPISGATPYAVNICQFILMCEVSRECEYFYRAPE